MTMSWYEKMVAAGRSKSLTTGNVRSGVAAVDEVLGSLALETPVNRHSELMEDSLRNIEPVQLGVEQTCQVMYLIIGKQQQPATYYNVMVRSDNVEVVACWCKVGL